MLGRRQTLTFLAAVGLASISQAALVWQSTFDVNADGVVDLFDNNTGKVMIGTNSGGRQQITAWDQSTNQYTPDKAGRPLGTTVGGNSSFSGLYEFQWSTYNQIETQAWEQVGFFGNSAPQTRQVAGAILRHWRVTGTNDYYIGIDIGAGSAGYTNFGYLASNSIWLGDNPEGKDFKLAIGYEGASHILSATLYDATGEVIASNAADLDTILTGGSAATELANYALTHLGWSDYTGYGGDKATAWQVDRLSYFDTAFGADEAAQGGGGTPGDFNGDNVVDVTDVDMLCAAIRGEVGPEGYDVNNDTQVNLGDLEHEIEVILGTALGDSDLALQRYVRI